MHDAAIVALEAEVGQMSFNAQLVIRRHIDLQRVAASLCPA